MRITYPDFCNNRDVMRYINEYGRLYGWYLANKLRLPVQNSCYLVITEKDIYEINEDALLYCRADMPWGKGNKLLRSGDISPNELLDFYHNAQTFSLDAIVLVFIHPSIWITGKYLQRYKTSGAAQILFRDDGMVILEMVCPGYDCGDISRGKTVHQRFILDKENICYSYDDLLRDNIINSSIFQIQPKDYDLSRDNRIQELTSFYGPNSYKDIDSSIPIELPSLREQFEIVQKTCILPVINNREIWNNYVIMLNIYQDCPYVYEVWQPKRSSVTS